jgi:multidrug efflux pump subunit AcrB
VTPAFVSLLCICIVFVPMFFLQGVARFLFVPMAEAVMFAMIWSFILSRTLVPTMARRARCSASTAPSTAVRARARAYALTLSALLDAARRFGSLFLGFCVLSCLLYPFLGRDFFPSVDAGQIRLHMRAPTGTRIEETARLADRVEAAIRS